MPNTVTWPFEPENRAVDVGLAEQDARVVDEIARGEIVGAVDDDVEILEEVEGVFAGELGFECFDLNVGIQIGKTRLRRGGFGLADIVGAKGDLALEIGEIHDIKIDESELADACRGEIQTQRRAKAAGADQQHFGVFQLELTVHADFRHDQVAAVAKNFFVGQRRGFGRRRCRDCVAGD